MGLARSTTGVMLRYQWEYFLFHACVADKIRKAQSRHARALVSASWFVEESLIDHFTAFLTT
jgi:hypothetical protein